MKTFLKIFAIAFGLFALAMGSGLWAFNHFYQPADEVISEEKKNEQTIGVVDSNKEKEEQEEQLVEEKSELEKLIEGSKRINMILLGMEGLRTDTMVFASFDPESKNLDLVSIPRDTYYARKLYTSADEKKINAVFGDEGPQGTIEAVREVLAGVPIDYYAKVDYNGVERIVDSLNGVSVTIPVDMDYDDPYDRPPLHIHLKKGTQVLNGKKAIQFLRYRKGNNGGGYPDGDLGRIRAQQKFLKAAIGKAIGFRLPVVANTVIKHVKTNITASDATLLAKDAIGMTKENFKVYSLPGKASYQNKSAYFLHDQDGAEELMKEIYRRRNE